MAQVQPHQLLGLDNITKKPQSISRKQPTCSYFILQDWNSKGSRNYQRIWCRTQRRCQNWSMPILSKYSDWWSVYGYDAWCYESRCIEAFESDNSKTLAISHHEMPELLYHNVQLYPCMFPHLFPYGLGGVGCQQKKLRMGKMHHIRRLLMYHDKLFQLDPHFLLIALNHQQIKSSNKGSYI